MATTTSLQSLHQPFLHHHHHHHYPSFTTTDSPLFLKPTTPHKLFSNLSSSSLTTPTTPTTTSPSSPSPSSSSSSFDTLAHHLSSNNFRLADDETRRLLIALAGDAAQKRGYVFFSEVQFISPSDLRAIDRLWRLHSDDKFGYSVQKKIWEKAKRDFTTFFLKVGWMKKLDSEVEQFNYRSFPNEFLWELKDDTPEGHLPLTNALRGIQLLGTILTHPAFETVEEEEEEKERTGDVGLEEKKERPKPIGSKMSLKPDYSF